MQSERSKKPRHRHSPAVGKSQYYRCAAPERLGWTGLLELRQVQAASLDDEAKYQILLNRQARYHGIWMPSEVVTDRITWLQSIGVKMVPLVRDPGRVKKAGTVKAASKVKRRTTEQPFYLLAEHDMF
jgi:hypothetical protein